MNSVNHPWRPLFLGGVIGVLAAIGYAGGLFQGWGVRATDRLFLSRHPDSSIVIVAIDDASIAQIGRWPWNRSAHAELISKLADAGAAAIGYDVNFPEASDRAEDVALASSLKRAGNVVLPVELSLQLSADRFRFDPSRTVAPLSSFSTAAALTGHVNTPPDVDTIVRRVPLAVASPDGGMVPAFAVQVLHVTHPMYPFASVPVDPLNRLIVNYSGEPGTSFPAISAVDILRGTADASRLNGKVIFVGATASDLHDAQAVAFSNGTVMPGVEIHASLYDTLVSERWLRPIPMGYQVFALIALGLLIGLFISQRRARISTPLIGVLWIVFLVGALVSFERGWIVDVVWPSLTIVFASFAVILERRITVDRERHQLRSAFSRYVSSSVVRSILSDPKKLKLGGEKRRMSVLFSDVRGFTSISETMSPEHLVEVMNTYLTRMTDIVFAQEGVLDKYIGDAVMAFWNAPFDQKDHARRAVKTALAMQQVLAEMNQTGAFPNGLALKIGVGINTGEMVVGNMGSEMRFDYTVIGDNVNLASRMEGITKEYGVGILISEATRQDVGDELVARRIDKVAVKGKKEPVVLYEAFALASEATDGHRTLVMMFETALDAYLAKDFVRSIALCEDLLRGYPDDGPTKNLLERARQLVKNKPPADWDGTWIFTKK